MLNEIQKQMFGPDFGETAAKKLQNVNEWFDAIELNNFEAIKASINRFKGSRMPSGDTALMIAANRGNFTLAKALCNYESKLQNNDGLSALMFATLAEQMDIVELLVESEKDCATPEGRDALMLGSEAGCTDVVALLLNYIPIRTDKYSRGALFYATCNLHVSTIRVLLESQKMPQSHIRDALTATTDTEIIAILSEYLVPDASYTPLSAIDTPVLEQSTHHTELHDETLNKTPSVESTALVSESTKNLAETSISTSSSTISRSASPEKSQSVSSVDSKSSSITVKKETGDDESTRQSIEPTASPEPSVSPTVERSSRTVSSTALITSIMSASGNRTTNPGSGITTTIVSSPSPNPPSKQSQDVSVDPSVEPSIEPTVEPSANPSPTASSPTVSSSVSSVAISSPPVSVTVSNMTRDQTSIQTSVISTQLEESGRDTVSPLVPRAISTTPYALQIEGSLLHEPSIEPFGDRNDQNEEIETLKASMQNLNEQLRSKDAKIASLQTNLNEIHTEKAIALSAASLAREALSTMQKQQHDAPEANDLSSECLSHDTASLVKKIKSLEKELDIVRKGYSAMASSKAEFAEIIEELRRRLAEYEGPGSGHGSLGSWDSPGARRKSPKLNGMSMLEELQQHLQSLVDANSQLNNLLNEKNILIDKMHLELTTLVKNHAAEIEAYKKRIQELSGNEAHNVHDSVTGTDVSAPALHTNLDVMKKVNNSLSDTLNKNQMEIVRLRARVDSLLREWKGPNASPYGAGNTSPGQQGKLSYATSPNSFGYNSAVAYSPGQIAKLSPAACAELEQLRRKMQQKDAVLKALERLSSKALSNETNHLLSILEKYIQTNSNEEDISLVLRLLKLEEENVSLRQKLARTEDGVMDAYYEQTELPMSVKHYSTHASPPRTDIDIELTMNRAADVKKSLDALAGMADKISSSNANLKMQDVAKPSTAAVPIARMPPYMSAKKETSQSAKSDLTPLMASIFHGDIEGVKRNMKYTGSVRSDGTTALMMAAQCGFAEAIPLLVAKEAQMRRRDNACALSLALKMQNYEIAELLRTAEGMDTKDISSLGGRTTELMFAARKNDIVGVWSLLNLQVGLQDISGRTALMYAAETGAIDVVRLLSPHEAKLVDFEGHDVMYWVTTNKSLSTTMKERFARELTSSYGRLL